MPSLDDLKKRISSVKSTQKITKAMKMVAASKLRRAQDSVEATRPYAKKMEQIVANISNSFQEDSSGLLMGNGKEENHLLIAITADRGLCGAYNSSIIREVRKIIEDLESKNKNVKVYCLGKKGADGISNYLDSKNLIKIQEMGKKNNTYRDADSIGREIISYYSEGNFDVCTLIYNHFKSVISQIVTSQTIIPYDLINVASSIINKKSEEQIFRFIIGCSIVIGILVAIPGDIGVGLYVAQALEFTMAVNIARLVGLDFKKENDDLLNVVGLFFEGEMYPTEKYLEFANLPTKEESLSKLVMMINQPMTRVALVLKGCMSKLVNTLTSLKDTKN